MRGEAEVARRVLGRLDAVLDRLAVAYRTVPEYAALPPGVLEAEVLPVSREIIEGFLGAAMAGREPAARDLPILAVMGRRRLEMGVPLEPMLHVYRLAGREVFDEIAAVTGPDEKHELAALGRAWMDYIDEASSAAATAYLDASHERLRRVDAQRGALLDSFLAAADRSDAAAVAAEFSISLASRYVPVLVAAPEVATRVDRIAAAAPAGSLVGFRGSQVVALVPDGAMDLDTLAPEAVVVHGHPVEPGAPLAAELRRTEALLDVALSRGRAGCHGPDDLLLEQLVDGSPRVGDALRRLVLDPLRGWDRGGQVEATLRTFLRTGSIPATAEAELVHANTVAYRLRRVADRLGLDPRRPDHAAVLTLALVVRSPTNGAAD